MKKLFFVASISFSILLSSCGSGSEKADKMADEMCSAMAKYKEDQPLTMLDAANDMMEISKKEQEYKDVTEDQLKVAMEKKCPDGYKKFMKMAEAGEEAEAK